MPFPRRIPFNPPQRRGCSVRGHFRSLHRSGKRDRSVLNYLLFPRFCMLDFQHSCGQRHALQRHPASIRTRYIFFHQSASTSNTTLLKNSTLDSSGIKRPPSGAATVIAWFVCKSVPFCGVNLFSLRYFLAKRLTQLVGALPVSSQRLSSRQAGSEDPVNGLFI